MRFLNKNTGDYKTIDILENATEYQKDEIFAHDYCNYADWVEIPDDGKDYEICDESPYYQEKQLTQQEQLRTAFENTWAQFPLFLRITYDRVKVSKFLLLKLILAMMSLEMPYLMTLLVRGATMGQKQISACRYATTWLRLIHLLFIV